MSFTRREFLGTAAAAATLNAAAPGAFPTRTLGRTGRNVSILAFGSGSRWLAYKEEDKAIEAMHRALDAGVTYVDTAYAYGNGESETRVGKALQGRRDKLFLATKIPDRNADEAMRRFEASLKRLQTDHVDLLHIHALGDAADLAKIEAPDGVLKLFYKLRDQKVARAIGCSCHGDPEVLKTALERHDFDCTQMALNAARAGSPPQPRAIAASFEGLALPVARRKNMGVIAMKVFGQDRLGGTAAPDQLIRYSLTLPGVTAVVVGMPKIEHIDQNIQIAKAYKPMPESEMRELSDKMAVHKEAMDRFFLHHIDC